MSTSTGPKLFTFDVDGTIKHGHTSAGHEIPIEIEKMFASLQNSNNYYTLITGRSYSRTKDFLTESGLEKYFNKKNQILILENGARAMTYAGETIYKNLINFQSIKKILGYCKDFAVEFPLLFSNIAASSDQVGKFYTWTLNPEVKNKLLSQNITGLEVFYGDLGFEQILKVLEQFGTCQINIGMQDDKNINLVYDYLLDKINLDNIDLHHHDRYITVTVKGINKGFGLSNLIDLCNITPSQCYFAGNDHNDMSVFKLNLNINKIVVGDRITKELDSRHIRVTNVTSPEELGVYITNLI